MTSQSRTVRVFLSSTFRDFAEERDLLVRKVRRFSRPVSFFQPVGILPQASLNQELSGSQHMHSVNSGVQDNAKISRIQGEECVALGCEGGDENRFVLGGGQEDRSPCAQGIRRPLDLSLQVLPMRSGLRLELVEIFQSFSPAIRRRNQAPSSLGGEDRDEPRERFLGSAGRKDHATIKKNPHILPEFFQNLSAPRSSSAIHSWSVSSGISRTGMASAGCRKTPPFLISTNIMGFSAASNPSTRRISGGRVIVPRFDTGIAVMQQYCNATIEKSNLFSLFTP